MSECSIRNAKFVFLLESIVAWDCNDIILLCQKSFGHQVQIMCLEDILLISYCKYKTNLILDQ